MNKIWNKFVCPIIETVWHAFAVYGIVVVCVTMFDYLF